jgi:hypothetical protein
MSVPRPPTDSTVVPGPTWNVTASSATGSPLESYRWTSAEDGTWLLGGGADVLSDDAFNLYADVGDLSGDNWVFLMRPYGPAARADRYPSAFPSPPGPPTHSLR